MKVDLPSMSVTRLSLRAFVPSKQKALMEFSPNNKEVCFILLTLLAILSSAITSP